LQSAYNTAIQNTDVITVSIFLWNSSAMHCY